MLSPFLGLQLVPSLTNDLVLLVLKVRTHINSRERSDPDSGKDRLNVYESQSIPAFGLSTCNCPNILTFQRGLQVLCWIGTLMTLKQRGVAVDKKRRFGFLVAHSHCCWVSLSSPLPPAYGSLILDVFEWGGFNQFLLPQAQLWSTQ